MSASSFLSGWKLSRPKRSSTIFANKHMREHINPALINGFIDAEMGITFPKTGKYKDYPFASELIQIKKYNTLFGASAQCYNTKYALAKHGWGRICPDKWLSISIFHRPTRHTLCCEKYIDLDMVNAQPQIVNEISKRNGVINKTWELYCKDPKTFRYAVADHYGCSYDAAKRLFLTLSFGGSYSTWLQDENINPNTELLSEVLAMEQEIQEVIDNVYEENRDICNDVLKAYPGKWTSLKEKKRGVMGLWCQTIERLLQECAVQYLVDERGFDIEDIVPCQDGIMILKDLYQPSICTMLSNAIQQNYGLNVQWIQKPFDQVLEGGIPACVEYRVMTDKDAAETVYKLYPHWVNCDDVLYVFNIETGMWSSKTIDHQSVFTKYVKELTVWYYDEYKDEYKKTNKSYGNTVSLMKNIPPLLSTLCQNNYWLKQNANSSLGKILFDNGYYDFNAQKFYSKADHGFNPSILFFEKINHNFEPFSEDDIAYMDSIKMRFFTAPLGEDVGNYFALALARGLAGEQLKSIYFGLGGTNCGKSVLSKAVAYSCGGYVGSFNAENLAYRSTGQDEAQIMRWVMLLRYKRLVFSNEMKNACLNGNMIKKISSGGDTIIGRTHNAVEQEFSSHFLAICMANDLPKIKPYDDAVSGRSNVISFNKEYVDEPLHEFHLKKDAGVEDEIQTLRFQRVFVGLLIREHMRFVDGGRKLVVPADAIVAKESWICQDKNYIDAFLNDYEITNEETNFVKSSDIEWWINMQDLGITMKKFGAELTKYAIINKLCNVYVKGKKVSGKNVNCWFGIKKNESTDECMDG